MEYITLNQFERLKTFDYYTLPSKKDELIISNNIFLIHFYFEDWFTREPDKYYKIYLKETGEVIKSGRLNSDGVYFERYVMSMLLLDSDTLKNLVAGLFNHKKLTFAISNSKKNYSEHFLNNKRNIVSVENKYFLEVYCFKEFSSVVWQSRPGKDNYFNDTTSTKYVVKLFNKFLDDEKLKSLLPEDEISYSESRGYSSTSEYRSELKFDLNKTILLIENYNS